MLASHIYRADSKRGMMEVFGKADLAQSANGWQSAQREDEGELPS